MIQPEKVLTFDRCTTWLRRDRNLKRIFRMRNTSRTKSTKSTITSWQELEWKAIDKYVEKVQQRIYHAESLGKAGKVRNLQRMLIFSRAALLVSIRQVTQINKGKRTAGVDGYKALTPEARYKLYEEMRCLDIKKHKPKPALRKYIEKKNGKLRPLGIPSIRDRVYQNIIKLALEPQWEAKFEPTSYGFRPKRSAHDAIERIFNSLGRKKTWIFEGDFRACFDNLNHEHILNETKDFPASKLIEKWLKAGFVDNNVFNNRDSGTPQGGIISPLLANIALHGMEKAIGIKYKEVKYKGITRYENRTIYAMAKYADDFVIMCESEEDAKEVYFLLDKYLKKRGLSLAEEKTKITHIDKGFDFLGFHIRRYDTKLGKKKLLIKPSKDSMNKARVKITQTARPLYGSNVGALIAKLNPIINGIGNYWRTVVAKEKFQAVDWHSWKTIYKFLRRLHPLKGWKWIRQRYFRPDRTGQSKDKWILTDPVTGIQIKKMSWIPIVRHSQIKHNFSPYNRMLNEYFKERDIRYFSKTSVSNRQKLAKIQKYKCPFCDKSIADGKEGLETHHKTPKAHGGTNQYKNLQLVHITCHIEYHRIFPVKGMLPDSKLVAKARNLICKKKEAGLIKLRLVG